MSADYSRDGDGRYGPSFKTTTSLPSPSSSGARNEAGIDRLWSDQFSIGERVEALWTIDKSWYSAIVVRFTSGGCIFVRWEDGTNTESLITKQNHVRKLSTCQPQLAMSAPFINSPPYNQVKHKPARGSRGDHSGDSEPKQETVKASRTYKTKGDAAGGSGGGGFKDKTSKYRGVSWDNVRCRWKVLISVGGHQRHVGYYDNDTDAAFSYDSAIIEHNLDRSKMNFPLAFNEDETKRLVNRAKTSKFGLPLRPTLPQPGPFRSNMSLGFLSSDKLTEIDGDSDVDGSGVVFGNSDVYGDGSKNSSPSYGAFSNSNSNSNYFYDNNNINNDNSNRNHYNKNMMDDNNMDRDANCGISSSRVIGKRNKKKKDFEFDIDHTGYRSIPAYDSQKQRDVSKSKIKSSSGGIKKGDIGSGGDNLMVVDKNSFAIDSSHISNINACKGNNNGRSRFQAMISGASEEDGAISDCKHFWKRLAVHYPEEQCEEWLEEIVADLKQWCAQEDGDPLMAIPALGALIGTAGQSWSSEEFFQRLGSEREKLHALDLDSRQELLGQIYDLVEKLSFSRSSNIQIESQVKAKTTLQYLPLGGLKDSKQIIADEKCFLLKEMIDNTICSDFSNDVSSLWIPKSESRENLKSVIVAPPVVAVPVADSKSPGMKNNLVSTSSDKGANMRSVHIGTKYPDDYFERQYTSSSSRRRERGGGIDSAAAAMNIDKTSSKYINVAINGTSTSNRVGCRFEIKPLDSRKRTNGAQESTPASLSAPDSDICIIFAEGISGQKSMNEEQNMNMMLELDDFYLMDSSKTVKLRDRTIIAANDDDELCRVIKSDQMAYSCLKETLLSTISDLHASKVKAVSAISIEKRKQWREVEEVFIKQSIWRTISLCVVKGMCDQVSDFSKQEVPLPPPASLAPNNSSWPSRRIHKKEASLRVDFGCMCCFDKTSYENNLIVLCDGCNASVHQNCYGISEIPQSDYFCERCSVLMHNSVSELRDGGLMDSNACQNTAKCCLCPNIHGGIKPTTDGRFVHMCCALWSKDAIITNLETMGPIDLSRIGRGLQDESEIGSLIEYNETKLKHFLASSLVSVSKRNSENQMDGDYCAEEEEEQSLSPRTPKGSSDLSKRTCQFCNIYGGFVVECSHHPSQIHEYTDTPSVDSMLPCKAIFHPLCAWLNGLLVESTITDPTFQGLNRNGMYSSGLEFKWLCNQHAPHSTVSGVSRAEQCNIRQKCRVSNLTVVPVRKEDRNVADQMQSEVDDDCTEVESQVERGEEKEEENEEEEEEEDILASISGLLDLKRSTSSLSQQNQKTKKQTLKNKLSLTTTTQPQSFSEFQPMQKVQKSPQQKNLSQHQQNQDNLEEPSSSTSAAAEAPSFKPFVKTMKTSSQFRGVYWLKVSNRWRAEITINNHDNYLGTFDCEEDAARAYDSAVVENNLCPTRLNFIGDVPQPKKGKSSKFRGVNWSRENNKWKAGINVNCHYRFIGYFEDEIEAAKACDAIVIENNLDKNRLNFVEDYQNPLLFEEGKSTKYRGIGWDKLANRWRVDLVINSRKKHIGYYDDEVEAAKAFDAAVLENGLYKVKLNFIRENVPSNMLTRHSIVLTDPGISADGGGGEGEFSNNNNSSNRNRNSSSSSSSGSSGDSNSNSNSYSNSNISSSGDSNSNSSSIIISNNNNNNSNSNNMHLTSISSFHADPSQVSASTNATGSFAYPLSSYSSNAYDSNDSSCCCVCKMRNNEGRFLICDAILPNGNLCSKQYHMYCLDPPVDVSPEDEWYCPSCTRGFNTDNNNSINSMYGNIGNTHPSSGDINNMIGLPGPPSYTSYQSYQWAPNNSNNSSMYDPLFQASAMGNIGVVDHARLMSQPYGVAVSKVTSVEAKKSKPKKIPKKMMALMALQPTTVLPHNVNPVATSSSFQGVTWDPATKSFRASVPVDGSVINSGDFDYKIAAAKAYDSTVVENNTDNAKMNFTGNSPQPVKSSDDIESKFRGVYWNKSALKWLASITLSTRQKFLGIFDDESVAARAFDAAVIENNLDRALLNFPVLVPRNLISNSSSNSNSNSNGSVSKQSRFRGVSWLKPASKWLAEINIQGQQRHLGLFDDELDAARSYDAAIIQNNIANARLNFPAADNVNSNSSSSSSSGSVGGGIGGDYVAQVLGKRKDHEKSPLSWDDSSKSMRMESFELGSQDIK